MLVTDLLTECQQWTDDASTTTAVSVRRWINETVRDVITRLNRLDLLEDIKYIPTRVRITGDGTSGNRCSVTAGSRQVLSMTLSSSSNVLTSGYTGATIAISGRNEVYRITDVSAVDQCLIDRPFEGSTSAVSSYDIIQDQQYLGTEVEEVISATRTTTPMEVAWWSGREKDAHRNFPFLRAAAGTPVRANVEGRHSLYYYVSSTSPDIRATVVDGSPTVTLATNAETTFNASSAGSILGLFGQEVIGAYFKLDREKRAYQIRRFTGVSGGTTFLLEEAYQLPSEFTATSALSWKMGHFDSMRVSLYPLPTSVEQFQYRYHRRLFDVEDSNDVLPLPEKFHHVLQYGVLHKALLWSGRADRAQQMKIEYEQGLRSIAEDVPNQARVFAVQPIPNKPRRIPGPVFPGNFGALGDYGS